MPEPKLQKLRGTTPSQTVGPFFKYGLTPDGQYDWNDAFTNNLVTPDISGDRIRIEGRVFDGDGKPVPDAMLEIWQADAQGRFADPQDQRALPNSKFRGFGRCGTDANGDYAFDTVKPGSVPDPDGKPQAPHILLAVFARGMLLHLYTRIYFERRGRQCRRSGAGAGADRSPRHADRRACSPASATRSIVSTSICRATTRRCFSTCECLSAEDRRLVMAGPSPGHPSPPCEKRILRRVEWIRG